MSIDKDSLREILSEFLTVEVSHREETHYRSGGVEVVIKFDGEIISAATAIVYGSSN